MVIKTFNAGIPLSADWLNPEIVQNIQRNEWIALPSDYPL